MIDKIIGSTGVEQVNTITFRRTVALASTAVAVIALAGLLGYGTGVRVLGSIRLDYVPMSPGSALCFIIFSMTLFYRNRKPLTGFGLTAAAVLVFLPTLFGLLGFVDIFVGTYLNYEEQLFPTVDVMGAIPLWRMSSVSGAGFTMTGVGMVLLLLRNRSSRYARQLGNWASSMGVLTVLVGATVLLAYLNGTPLMYSSGSAVPMAATTALAFIFMGVALAASAGPESFPVCRVTGDSTSSLLSRVFIPLVVAAVILQSILTRSISATHLVNEALIMAMLVIVIGLITASVVDRVASSTGSNIDEISGRLRQALKDLEESEEHHRSILQTAMDGVWLVDTGGLLLEVNESYCRMSGYSEQELLAMKAADLEVADTGAQIQKVIAQGEDRFESRHRRKDGTLFDVEVSVQCRPVKGGQLVAFLHDITERKRAEKELLESRKEYCDLVEGIPDLITRVDTEGRILFVNHTALEIFGLAPEECIGRPAFDFIHREDREPTVTAFQAWQRGCEEIFTFENRQVAIDGREHVMAWLIRAEHDKNGAVCGFASTARDITDRRKDEEEKAKLESQLHQAQKLESVGSLAGGVAHDFNNMLSVILGHASMSLNKVESTHPLYSHLEGIRNAAERSADLTRQLLAFARKQTIAPKVLDLNETVTSTLKMLQRLIGENIQLTWIPAPEPWLLKVDPSQVDQILTNLCVNARDSVTEGGAITIETGNSTIGEDYCARYTDVLPGEYVRLAVSDNGCGMDNDTLGRIFEPFFTTKEMGKGTGLGLATVFGIVKQNKGFINVYSEPGLGTTFTVYLPRHRGMSCQVQEELMAMPVPRGMETILLVEDELTILNVVTMILATQGYTVLQANTPAEALLLAKEHPGEIRLLITDVIMPKMNGKDLANGLQSLYPQLRCLFMSGYTADAIAQHGVLHEGVNFIQKPFSLSDLAIKVREVLDC